MKSVKRRARNVCRESEEKSVDRGRRKNLPENKKTFIFSTLHYYIYIVNTGYNFEKKSRAAFTEFFETTFIDA